MIIHYVNYVVLVIVRELSHCHNIYEAEIGIGNYYNIDSGSRNNFKELLFSVLVITDRNQ